MTPKQVNHAFAVIRRNTAIHTGDTAAFVFDHWKTNLSDRTNLRRLRGWYHNSVRKAVGEQ